MIITRTPLRLSLIGGGTDMPEYYTKRAGAVVSMAINKYVYVSVNKRFEPMFRVSYTKTEHASRIQDIEHELVRESLLLGKVEHGLEITSIADVPGNGTGLGSSSAFTVGLLKALYPDTAPGALAERAFMVEAEKCHHPVGKQDQYACAHGGVNFITFGKRMVRVTPVGVSRAWKQKFEEHALLLYTGSGRDANQILKEQAKSLEKGDSLNHGQQLADMAHALYGGICDQSLDIQGIGELLGEAWELKKYLAGSITNDTIDKHYETAMGQGAYGGKLLGAGGGGFLFFLADPDRHEAIARATGLRRVAFKIEDEGSKVIYDG